MAGNFIRLLRDRRGSIAISSALLFTTMIGIAALGVDVGTVYTDRRKAQNVADLAVIAAVSDLTNADKAAAATIARNKVSNADYTLQYGVYTADLAVAPGNRFAASSAQDANAVRVILKTTTPLYFAKLITGKDSFAVQTTSTATQSAFANFSIGSRLLSVNGGLVNQLLGGLLGSDVSLSVMDYQALISSQIDLFGFMNALATRLQITSGTYDQILTSNVKVGVILNALTDAGRAQYGSLDTAVRAIAALAQSAQASNAKLSVKALVDLGPYTNSPVGQTPKASVMASAYDIVSAAGQIANGDHQIELAVNAGIPGIASATLKLAIGERPKGKSWVTVGPVNSSVYTAQTRVQLKVQLVGTGSYSLVTLPIYMDIASGEAKLSALSCGFPNIATSSVTVAVKPGVVDAWIGDTPSSQFTNFTSAPSPSAAAIVDTPLLKISGKAHVNISNMSATPVTFSYSDIVQRNKKTVGTTDFTASLLSRLVTDTQLDINGLTLPGLSAGVAGILANAVSPVDQLLSSVLQTLGVGLGQADVWVTGIRCDGAVLVI